VGVPPATQDCSGYRTPWRNACNASGSLSARREKTTEFLSVVPKLANPSRSSNCAHEVPTREFLEFFGSVDLPKRAFRVAVSAADRNDEQYPRFFLDFISRRKTWKSLEIGLLRIASRSTKQAAFTGRHIGFARTFKLTVPTASIVAQGEPKELAVGCRGVPERTRGVTIPAEPPGIAMIFDRCSTLRGSPRRF